MYSKGVLESKIPYYRLLQNGVLDLLLLVKTDFRHKYMKSVWKIKGNLERAENTVTIITGS